MRFPILKDELNGPQWIFVHRNKQQKMITSGEVGAKIGGSLKARAGMNQENHERKSRHSLQNIGHH